MRKFIRNIFLFFVFTTTFYLCALFLWGSSYTLGRLKPNINYKIGSYGHMYTRMNEIKNVNNLDILFLGSSHTYRGFDTRIFKKHGLNTFNLGSSAQTPIQTLTLLNRYLDKLQPKLIIYEVFPPTLSSDGVESSMDIIANDKNDFYSYQMALNINKIKTYNTLLYGTLRDLFQLNYDFVEPKQKGQDLYVKNGFVEKKMKYYTSQSHVKNKIILKKNQLKSFEQILNIIKKKNIKLHLVYAPITKNLYSSYANKKSYDSLMASYGKYYNFNEIMNLKDSLHFYDSHHLNQKGVKLFNEKLLNVIEK